MITPESASDGILKRVRLMAQFISERHLAEFEDYWNDQWPGKAHAHEVIIFFSEPLEKNFILGRKM